MGTSVMTRNGETQTASFQLLENAIVLDENERPIAPGSGKAGLVAFRAALIIASLSALVALAGLWSTTSRQRMQLAEQDVAALGHVDDYALQLTRRLVATLSQSPPPKTRADLLKAYAGSDLASAEYPAILGVWNQTGRQTAEFAVAPSEPDSALVASAVKEAIATKQTVTRSILGATGVQILAAVSDSLGGATSILNVDVSEQRRRVEIVLLDVA